jgi:hypothetical protein
VKKKKQEKSCITKLATDNGEATTDAEILEAAREFYKRLYTEEPVDEEIQEWFLSQLDMKLDENTKQQCEGPVTKDELTKAMKRMNLNKSPGPDGLTTEFYQTFWAELADDLVELFNTNFSSGTMTTSQDCCSRRIDATYLPIGDQYPCSTLITRYSLPY